LYARTAWISATVRLFCSILWISSSVLKKIIVLIWFTHKFLHSTWGTYSRW
jgi:hypothetical protein